MGRRTIGILGGTGELGSGLAQIWSRAGHSLIIGSRAQEAAKAAAARLGGAARGETNWIAARDSEIVVLCVPYAAHEAALREIRDVVRGKIVVDAVVPLMPPKVSVAQLPPRGSAALIAQDILGAETRVVAAFHNVAAKKLKTGTRVDCDVLVFGDEREARDVVIALAEEVADRALDGGALANSAASEALTSVLISINRRYKANGAGIRITGLDLAK